MDRYFVRGQFNGTRVRFDQRRSLRDWLWDISAIRTAAGWRLSRRLLGRWRCRGLRLRGPTIAGDLRRSFRRRHLAPHPKDRVGEIEHLLSQNWVLPRNKDQHVSRSDDPLLVT